MTLETASQPQPLPDGDIEKVCAVTVTYGRRWHLLRQVIASALSEGLSEIIVIDNAAQDDIAKLAAEEFGDFAYVVRMPKNTGSAGGFKAGLEQAMARNADYILLLDDDNKLGAGCVATLRAGYRAELAAENGRAGRAGQCAAGKLLQLPCAGHSLQDMATLADGEEGAGFASVVRPYNSRCGTLGRAIFSSCPG